MAGVYGRVNQIFTNVPYDHPLKELDADDWSPGPILYQACLASTLCRGQRFAGGEVHVILIVFAEYSVKRLERRK